jgi:hypothetical protein
MPGPDVIKIGIAGLDDILFGGIPRGNVGFAAEALASETEHG